MHELIFSSPGKNDGESIAAFSERREGCELFTRLKTDGLAASAEKLWCGKNDEGIIKELIFSSFETVYRFFPEKTVISPAEKSGLLFSESTKSSFTLMSFNSAAPEKSDINIIELKEMQTAQLYKLLSSACVFSDCDEKRYVYRLRCINRSLAEVFAVFVKGEIVSAACITAKNSGYALIGDVFTKPEYRKKGLASELISHCLRSSLEQGKRPWLFCENDKLHFYERLGFTKTE